LRTKKQNTLVRNNKFTLPAEWYEQSAVQLTWPHSGTDWRPILKDVTRCYLDMAKAIAGRQQLIIVTPEPYEVQRLLRKTLSAANMRRIVLCEAPSNDTWARDHGFLTLISPEASPRLLDFKFNGWGKKFPSKFDNCICRRMARQGILTGRYENHLDFVLEGGSIESDGRGTIMTTSQCLLAPNRNQPLSQAQIEERLLKTLHAERILWLDHGNLAGDDTDGHIDTLARFCPDGTIAYELPYANFCWSSPVCFLNEHDEMFIFTGNASGVAYLVRAKDGEVLCKKEVGANFESSPCVVGNAAVVGCRGTNIYKFVIK